MSDNVVPLFGPRIKNKQPPNLDIGELIWAISSWAEDRGVDVSDDIGFQIRCTDFMTYLQLMVKEEDARQTA